MSAEHAELSRRREKVKGPPRQGPWYNPPAGVREFFNRANLGSYDGRSLGNYLSDFTRGNSPITRGLMVSLLSAYAEANNMALSESKFLRTTPEFEAAFGDIFELKADEFYRKQLEKEEDQRRNPPKDGKKPFVADPKPTFNRFPRTLFTSIAGELLGPKDNVEFGENAKKNYQELIQEQLDVLNRDPPDRDLFNYEKRSHLLPNSYTRIANTIGDPGVLIAARVADMQAALSNKSHDATIRTKQDKKAETARNKAIKKAETDAKKKAEAPAARRTTTTAVRRRSRRSPK